MTLASVAGAMDLIDLDEADYEAEADAAIDSSTVLPPPPQPKGDNALNIARATTDISTAAKQQAYYEQSLPVLQEAAMRNQQAVYAQEAASHLSPVENSRTYLARKPSPGEASIDSAIELDEEDDEGNSELDEEIVRQDQPVAPVQAHSANTKIRPLTLEEQISQAVSKQEHNNAISPISGEKSIQQSSETSVPWNSIHSWILQLVLATSGFIILVSILLLIRNIRAKQAAARDAVPSGSLYVGTTNDKNIALMANAL